MKNKLLDFLLTIGVITLCISVAFLIVMLLGLDNDRHNFEIKKDLEQQKTEKSHEH